MKRVFIFLLGGLMIVPSFAGPDDTNEVCKRNTLVMAVLQNDVNGVEYVKNQKEKKWAVRFDYDLFAGTHPKGIVAYVTKGRTTCNMIDFKSSDDGKSSNAGTASVGEANTFLKAAPQDVGVNCWCKMDGPVTSWWTYLKKYNSNEDCEQNCTELCANRFTYNKNIDGGDTGILIRDALYNKVW